MSWYRKRTSRFRSPRCARRWARTAMSSARNSAAAIGSPACSAQMPAWMGGSPRYEQSCGRGGLTFPRTVGNRRGAASVRSSHRLRSPNRQWWSCPAREARRLGEAARWNRDQAAVGPPDDERLLQDLAAHRSPKDMRLRFLTAMRGLSHERAPRLAHIRRIHLRQ